MSKAGQIALFKCEKNSLLDKIISDITKSQYVHAGFFVSETEICEEWWSGVRVRNMSNETGFDIFEFIESLTQEQIDKGIEYAKSKIGTKYNFLALIGILLEKVFGLKYNIFSSKFSMICSEFCIDICEVMLDNPNLHKEVKESDDSSVSPSDISKWDRLVKVEFH